MHYFKRNIGEYHKKAGKLSMLEHGAYTLLIDACYDRERFPSLDDAIDWCWARSDEEIAAVHFVLKKFFTLIDGLYVQNRIREEIDQYQANAAKNKEIALEREAKKRDAKARTVHGQSTNEHERAPKQEPININQEPIINNYPSDSVPLQKIAELFNDSFPELPKVKQLTDKRKTAVRRRWLENQDMQDLERWSKFFAYCRLSDFLMGRTVNPWNGFCFDWLFTSSNFIKIREGNYHK